MEGVAGMLGMTSDWEDQAACAGTELDLFFPPKGGDAPALVGGAKAICAGCTVRMECLEFALRNDIGFGVWGGLAPAERRRVRDRRRRTSAA